jgi:hypothetical protein
MEENLEQPDWRKTVPTITTGTGAEPPLAPSNCSASSVVKAHFRTSTLIMDWEDTPERMKALTNYLMEYIYASHRFHASKPNR